eukprot:jgi/Mesen1/8579/ME000497S07987
MIELKPLTVEMPITCMDPVCSASDGAWSAQHVTSWLRGPLLGAGAFGSVSLALNRETGQLFAVKSVDSDRSPSELRALENELAILQYVDSPRVVRCLGSDRTQESNGSKRNLFLEYLPGGSIADLMKKFGGKLEEQLIRTYTRGIVEGLRDLHRQGIMHSDVKGQNVLLGESGVKLCDLGSASFVESGQFCPVEQPPTTLSSLRGTICWMAPEVVRQSEQGPPSDIWSLGCTVIEMATAFAPWGVVDALSAMYKLGCSEDLPEFPPHLSEAAHDFLSKCLQREPSHRLTAEQLLLHPFLCEPLDLSSPRRCEASPSSPSSVLDFPSWASYTAARGTPLANSVCSNLSHLLLSPQTSERPSSALGAASDAATRAAPAAAGGAAAAAAAAGALPAMAGGEAFQQAGDSPEDREEGACRPAAGNALPRVHSWKTLGLGLEIPEPPDYRSDSCGSDTGWGWLASQGSPPAGQWLVVHSPRARSTASNLPEAPWDVGDVDGDAGVQSPASPASPASPTGSARPFEAFADGEGALYPAPVPVPVPVSVPPAVGDPSRAAGHVFRDLEAGLQALARGIVRTEEVKDAAAYPEGRGQEQEQEQEQGGLWMPAGGEEEEEEEEEKQEKVWEFHDAVEHFRKSSLDDSDFSRVLGADPAGTENSPLQHNNDEASLSESRFVERRQACAATMAAVGNAHVASPVVACHTCGSWHWLRSTPLSSRKPLEMLKGAGAPDDVGDGDGKEDAAASAAEKTVPDWSTRPRPRLVIESSDRLKGTGQ